MIDSEKGTLDEPEDPPKSEVIPSKIIFLILTIFAILASFSGFFILLSIIAVSSSSATILYPYGFILGSLLLLGGLILLLSMIFLHQESKKTTGVAPSNTNEKGPII